MSKLLIVIPAHNEEANIVQVVEELTRSYPQYDYVVVNDGSRDKTAALCRAHGYRLIDLPVNLGLAGAFQTGLRFAAENGYVRTKTIRERKKDIAYDMCYRRPARRHNTIQVPGAEKAQTWRCTDNNGRFRLYLGRQ